MPDNNKRRLEIQNILLTAQTPVTASALAQKFKVSRQTIVGDIALLRAAGEAIVPSPRGYKYFQDGQQVMKLVCRHFPDQAADEMMRIVNNGGIVKDVEVEHPLYGIIRGELNISTASDVRSFVKKMKQDDSHLLSELTNGIHTHTVMTTNQEQMTKIRQDLAAGGYLYQ
ncbi:transcription repressor NadR [Lapidilactobacillus dextrinicus]|uniref:transcription repressor NadR n=1 Tax=Lapidilactobacillus dextrinicus TaxID=51664 RepID=UPI0022DED879|nr:transcription repressor NadR [Lapidilactobacillus dextrinicus]